MDRMTLDLTTEDYQNTVSCLYAASRIIQALETLGVQINVGPKLKSEDIRLLTNGIALSGKFKRGDKPETPDLRDAAGIIVDLEEPGEGPFAQFTDENYGLCYVRGPWAWFTTQPVTEQWGDDWNDAPYEHNAGSPYKGDTWKIKKIAWEGPFEEPCDGHQNSPYSVKVINAGRKTPWLRPDPWTENPSAGIWAGASLPKFIEAMTRAGGQVYQY